MRSLRPPPTPNFSTALFPLGQRLDFKYNFWQPLSEALHPPLSKLWTMFSSFALIFSQFCRWSSWSFESRTAARLADLWSSPSHSVADTKSEAGCKISGSSLLAGEQRREEIQTRMGEPIESTSNERAATPGTAIMLVLLALAISSSSNQPLVRIFSGQTASHDQWPVVSDLLLSSLGFSVSLRAGEPPVAQGEAAGPPVRPPQYPGHQPHTRPQTPAQLQRVVKL